MRQELMNEPSSAHCRIGTSGWNYKHWANGAFYPAGLPARRWLEFYSNHFKAVEVNNSYYTIPSPESLLKWVKATPSYFTFALKLWRGITHYRKLYDCRELLERYFAFAAKLPPDRRAPLLIQLPPHLPVNLSRLQEFFTDLRSVLHGARWRIAMEFRHSSWLTREVYEFLDGQGAAIVLSDHARCKIEEANHAPFVYLRRHGGEDEGSYSMRQIAQDAKAILQWLAAGREVYVYYNNDWHGYAINNAWELMQQLGVKFWLKPPKEPTLFG